MWRPHATVQHKADVVDNGPFGRKTPCPSPNSSLPTAETSIDSIPSNTIGPSTVTSPARGISPANFRDNRGARSLEEAYSVGSEPVFEAPTLVSGLDDDAVMGVAKWILPAPVPPTRSTLMAGHHGPLLNRFVLEHGGLSGRHCHRVPPAKPLFSAAVPLLGRRRSSEAPRFCPVRLPPFPYPAKPYAPYRWPTSTKMP